MTDLTQEQEVQNHIKTYRAVHFPVIIVGMQLQVCWGNNLAKEMLPQYFEQGTSFFLKEFGAENIMSRLEQEGSIVLSEALPLHDLQVTMAPIYKQNTIIGALCILLKSNSIPKIITPVTLSGQTSARLSNGIRESVDNIFSIMDVASNKAEMMQFNWIKSSFSRIAVSSYRILRISGNVAEYARFCSGEMHLEMTVTDILTELRAMEQALLPLAQSMDIPVRFDWPPETELLVKMDAARFERALFNVVHNSLYYTQPGNQVNISVRGTANSVIITVFDKGIGIPEDIMGDLFTPYFSYNRNGIAYHSGMGLGLTLSKIFTEAHGGTLQVSSKEGEGTRVTMELPLVSSFDTPISLNQNSSIPNYNDRFSVVYTLLSDAATSPYREKKHRF